MLRGQIREKVERLHAIWNTGDLGVISEVYSEDFVAHMLRVRVH